MKRVEKIIEGTTAPIFEGDMWLDTTDPQNPDLKVLSGGKYKEVNGAASVSTTDPATGKAVTGLKNVLNALADLVNKALLPYSLEQDVPVNTKVEITGKVYDALMNSLAIRQGNTEIIPRADALMFGAPEGIENYNALQQLIFDTIDDSADSGYISAVFVRGEYPYDEGAVSGQFDVYVILTNYSGDNPVYYLYHIFKES